MNFTCDKCQKRYSIADEKVRGRTVKIRCKSCQNLMSVQGPAGGLDATAMLPSDRMDALKEQDRAFSEQDGALTTRRDGEGNVIVDGLWFAMVKGKQVGPLEMGALTAKAKAGEITPRTYLWKEGMADWKRAADLSEMAQLFGGALGPPEPPARPAPRKAAEPVASLDVTELEGTPAPAAANPAKAPKKESKAAAPAAAKAKPREEPAADPFAQLGELDPAKLPPAGEATRFFIAQAGVNKRNPPWKIALFVSLVILIPVGSLYLLSELKVVPLKITRVDEKTGQEVEQSVFSAEGVSGLSDLLTGKSKKTKTLRPPPERVVGRAPAEKPTSEPSAPDTRSTTQVVKETKREGGPSQADLSALYGDSAKRDVGPKVRKGEETKAQDTTVGGLAEAEVARVVGQTQPAFQSCIEQEMRKNPSFKGGKVNIVASVATSGIVTRAQIDRNDIDRSGLGDCLKGRAKRMVFSSFAGEETDVQIPLILGTTL